MTPECNIRNPNHPIYLALESALHNLTPGGYLRPRRPCGYHQAREQRQNLQGTSNHRDNHHPTDPSAPTNRQHPSHPPKLPPNNHT